MTRSVNVPMLDALTVARIESIRSKLARVVAMGARPFGFENHQLELRPPVDERDLDAFEELYGVSLPEDYRAFLLGVASGGAGPGYGLAPFEDAPCYERSEYAPVLLTAPFPHTEAHLLYEEDLPTEVPDPPGTLVLSHEGCGYLHLLIVSGDARGQVWIDAYTSDVGIFPIAQSFSEWYERWLDSILAGGDGCWWLNHSRDR